MKKYDCKYYEPITVIEYGQCFDEMPEYQLVDEVCSVEETSKHHNEFDCDNCKKYEKIGDLAF